MSLNSHHSVTNLLAVLFAACTPEHIHRTISNVNAEQLSHWINAHGEQAKTLAQLAPEQIQASLVTHVGEGCPVPFVASGIVRTLLDPLNAPPAEHGRLGLALLQTMLDEVFGHGHNALAAG